MTAEKEHPKRSRASIACAACRTRRTKCVIAPGERQCKHCLRSQIQCVIKNDDERKRPVCRAHVEFLTSRVEQLEKMLKQNVDHTPPSRSEADNNNDEDSMNMQMIEEDSMSHINTEDFNSPPLVGVNLQKSLPDALNGEAAWLQSNNSCSIPHSARSSKSKRVVQKLFSTKGHWNYDGNNGNARYYSPTMNIHAYSDLSITTSQEDTWDQKKRTSRVVSDLFPETHDYLMDLFWTLHNSIIHVTHKDLFSRDQESGRTRYYSEFLHICMLAVGCRLADRTKPAIRRLMLRNGESTLHREAKYLLGYELNTPDSLHLVQALLLLGDLEFGVAKDNSGWMYVGMACHLALDIGLKLDCTELGIDKEEVQVRNMIFLACTIYDKYWALWLGRPTNFRKDELDNERILNQGAHPSPLSPVGSDKDFETQIYTASLQLMEHAYFINEKIKVGEPEEQVVYSSIFAFDQKLRGWYRKLPEQLKWLPSTIAKAPPSFFLLHQQFHTLLLMAYRDFAECTSGIEEKDMNDKITLEYGTENIQIQLARTICFESAVQVSRIIHCHRKRFNTRQTFATSMQHAGTAAVALIHATARTENPMHQSYSLKHLRILIDALEDMACIYRPAELMLDVLQLAIRDFGWKINDVIDVTPHAVTPHHFTPQSLSSQVNSDSAVDTTSFFHSTIAPHEQAASIIDSFSGGDFNIMDMSFDLNNGALQKSQLPSASGWDRPMCGDRNKSQELVPLDATVMPSPDSDLMHDLEFSRPHGQVSSVVDQETLLNRPLSNPDDIMSSYKINNTQRGFKPLLQNWSSTIFGEGSTEMLRSWDDIF